MGRKSKTFEERRVSVGVTLPYNLVQSVDAIVHYYGVTRTNFVERALNEYLQRCYSHRNWLLMEGIKRYEAEGGVE